MDTPKKLKCRLAVRSSKNRVKRHIVHFGFPLWLVFPEKNLQIQNKKFCELELVYVRMVFHRNVNRAYQYKNSFPVLHALFTVYMLFSVLGEELHFRCISLRWSQLF